MVDLDFQKTRLSYAAGGRKFVYSSSLAVALITQVNLWRSSIQVFVVLQSRGSELSGCMAARGVGVGPCGLVTELVGWVLGLAVVHWSNLTLRSYFFVNKFWQKSSDNINDLLISINT